MEEEKQPVMTSYSSFFAPKFLSGRGACTQGSRYHTESAKEGFRKGGPKGGKRRLEWFGQNSWRV